MKAFRKFMRVLVAALALSYSSPAIYAAANSKSESNAITVDTDAGYAYNSNGGFVPLDAPANVNASFYAGEWAGFQTSAWNETGTLTPVDPYGMYCACTCETNATDNSTTPTPADGADNSTANSTSPSSANGTDNTTADSTSPSSANGTDNSTANSTDTSTANSTSPDSANSTDNSTTNTTSPSSANSTDNSTANSTSPSSGNSTDNSTANSTTTTNTTSNSGRRRTLLATFSRSLLSNSSNDTANSTSPGSANSTSNSTANSPSSANTTDNSTANSTSSSNTTDNSTTNSTSPDSANSTDNSTANSTSPGSADNSTDNSTTNTTSSSPTNSTDTSTSPDTSASTRAPPSTCYCSCPSAPPPPPTTPPPPPPPPPPTDLAALCASNPSDPACAEKEANDAQASVQYIWTISQTQEQACVAPTDRFGFCDNPSAEIKLALVCQKQAVSTDGTVQVLAPLVDVSSLSPDTPNNQCTESNKPADSKRTFKCADRTCEVLEARNRTISDCFSLQGQDCGDTYRIVEAFCYSATMAEIVPVTAALAGTACENVTQGTALDACPAGDPCPAFFYRYAPWSACSATCDNCSPPTPCDLTGSKTRAATCSEFASNGTIVAANEASCDAATRVISQTCNKKCFHPLLRFIRTLGECVSTQCDMPGLSSVLYTACTSGNGCQQWPNVTTAGTADSVTCPAVPCSPCAEVACSDPGTMSQAAVGGKCQCTCNPGYTGSRCHIEEGRTYKVLSADGSECASGVTDLMGTCCVTGDVDGCGYCTGADVPSMGSVRVGFDINGECCHGENDVFITTSLTCCQSLSDLDECGVCGGSSDTCSKAVSGSLSIPVGSSYSAGSFVTAVKTLFPAEIAAKMTDESSTSRRLLLQTSAPVALNLAAGVSTGAAELTAAFVRTGTSEFNEGNLAGAPAAPQAQIQGTPNNGVCETGELPGEPDCPEPQSCPMPTAMDDGEVLGNAASQCAGKGICMRASGLCRCNSGYAGDACDRCDEAGGFVAVPTDSGNACTRLAQDFVAPTAPPPVPMPMEPPAADEDNDSGMGVGVIVGIVIGAVGGVAILVGIVYYMLRVRGAKEVSPV